MSRHFRAAALLLVGVALAAIAWLAPILLLAIVPPLLAVGAVWLLIRGLRATSIGGRIVDRYSNTAVWFGGLTSLAVAAIGSGIALHAGIAVLHGDPCLSDWDVECATPWAERLSVVQIAAWPLVLIGQGAGFAAFVAGAVLVGQAIARRTRPSRPAPPVELT